MKLVKFSSKRTKIVVFFLTLNMKVSINSRRCRKCFPLQGDKHFVAPVSIFRGINKKKRDESAALVANLTVIDYFKHGK